MTKKNNLRTSAGLRDMLFDEIEELQGTDGNPTKALAVAKLAQQIVGIAKVEMDFAREVRKAADANAALPELGSLMLGSRTVVSAEKNATDH